jgi:DNA-binding beta-propeller fold protein YncE
MFGWRGLLSWRARVVGLLLVVVVVYVAPAVTPAFGARGHVFERTIGSKGKGNGQFEEPAGIAVSEASGDIYVADKGSNRVEFLNAVGEFQGQFDGSGSFPNEVNGEGEVTKAPEPLNLGLGNAVAVDNACVQHKLAEPACKSFDPSNGDVYVSSGAFGSMVIDKFTATGAYISQIKETTEASAFELVHGVAVDTNGELWVSEQHETLNGVDHFTNAEVNAFVPPFVAVANTQLEGGLAVDGEDDLYVHVANGAGESPVRKLGSSGQVLDKELDPESSVPNNGVATEVPSGDVYVDNVTSVKRFAGDGLLVEGFGESEMAGGSCPGECTDGVAVNSLTGQVSVSEGPLGVLFAFGLHPAAAPLVVSESVLAITSESATLGGELNPQSVVGEAGTTYRFEYGVCGSPSTCSSSAYGFSTPVASLAASFNVDAVSAHVQGLTAGAVYHYRVVAENGVSKAEGIPVVGVEQVFLTRGAGEFVLPDAREWEMVSPPQKNGALINPIGLGEAIQSAPGGSAISYATNIPSETEPQGFTATAQVLSTRGAGGWVSRDLAVPHEAATGLAAGQGQEVRFFSEDLSAAVVQPFGNFDKAISAEASEQTAFRYSDYANGSSGGPCTSSCFQPLVTAANATAREPFGEEGLCGTNTTGVICGPEFLGATADLAHIVVKSGVALTDGGGPGLYEWSAGKPAGEQLQPVGGGATVLGLRTANGAVGDAGRHAISEDGSRVFASTGGRHLIMSDSVSHKELVVDAPEAGCLEKGTCGGGPVDAEYQGASSDGRRVFFADTQKLTAEGAEYASPRNRSSSAADLYECEIVEVGGVPECRLRDLAPGGAQLGSVVGVSEDGSWVYFVANGVLASGAVTGGCPNQLPLAGFEAGRCNLYVRHGGVTRLVAVVSAGDISDWALQLGGLTARVSPGGGWLAFMSRRSLTGYDNRDAVSGKPDQEVFLYDGVSGRLVCASCDPTGARPHGVEYNGGRNLQLAGGNGGVWVPSTWIAGSVPTWTPYTLSSAIYQSRYLSDSGRLFFDGGDALVPKDVNGTEDVYEYEPAGVPAGEHACGGGGGGGGGSSSGSGSEVYSAGQEVEVEGRVVVGGAGCVALVSSGASVQESAFLDASASGGDVFFLTTAKLSTADFDDALDVYDAHECTGASPCLQAAATVPAACGTEASCKPAASAQPEIFGPPSSATFAGPENVPPPPPAVRKLTAAQVRAARLAKALKVCRRDHVRRKRLVCERRARKRYGALRARRARNVRETKR